jgi:hypothetical protein
MALQHVHSHSPHWTKQSDVTIVEIEFLTAEHGDGAGKKGCSSHLLAFCPQAWCLNSTVPDCSQEHTISPSYEA